MHTRRLKLVGEGGTGTDTEIVRLTRAVEDVSSNASQVSIPRTLLEAEASPVASLSDEGQLLVSVRLRIRVHDSQWSQAEEKSDNFEKS